MGFVSQTIQRFIGVDPRQKFTLQRMDATALSDQDGKKKFWSGPVGFVNSIKSSPDPNTAVSKALGLPLRAWIKRKFDCERHADFVERYYLGIPKIQPVWSLMLTHMSGMCMLLKHDAPIEMWQTGVGMFLAGGLFLRLSDVFYQQLCLIQDNRSCENKETKERQSLALELKSCRELKNLFDDIQKLLQQDPSFLKFLGYDCESFGLLNELGGFDIEWNNTGCIGFLPEENVLKLSLQLEKGAFCHELMHALHFRATMRAVTWEHVKKVVDKLDGNSVLADDYSEEMALLRESLASHRCGETPSEEVRRAAAILVWRAAILSGKLHEIEAVGTHYEYKMGVMVTPLVDRLANLAMFIHYPFVKALALLGGFSRSNTHIRGFKGYHNGGWILKRMMSKGLMESLLG